MSRLDDIKNVLALALAAAIGVVACHCQNTESAPSIQLPHSSTLANGANSSSISLPPTSSAEGNIHLHPAISSDREEISAFLNALKHAVATDDRRQVADLTRFPVHIEVLDRGQVADQDIDRETFIMEYDRIMTTCIKESIAEARLDRLLSTTQGLAIGRGQVWFDFAGDRYRILTINNSRQWCDAQ